MIFQDVRSKSWFILYILGLGQKSILRSETGSEKHVLSTISIQVKLALNLFQTTLEFRETLISIWKLFAIFKFFFSRPDLKPMSFTYLLPGRFTHFFVVQFPGGRLMRYAQKRKLRRRADNGRPKIKIFFDALSPTASSHLTYAEQKIIFLGEINFVGRYIYLKTNAL